MEMNDPKVYAMIGEGDTDGVFQMESGGMRRFLKDLKPTGFEDIIAGIALYRPGLWIQYPNTLKASTTLKSVTYVHEKLKLFWTSHTAA
jgi:DNA polymerase-3 subunit alpha